jgi:hypothetical protein
VSETPLCLHAESGGDTVRVASLHRVAFLRSPKYYNHVHTRSPSPGKDITGMVSYFFS